MPQLASRPSNSVIRAGITLIEMLIAIAVSLIVMYAVIQAFDYLNDGMNRSKATIEQAGELRAVTHRLQQDLDGLTASTKPWTPTGAEDGVLEIIEGPQRDADPDGDGMLNPPTMWGDLDDVLIVTSRSKGRPFIGRFNGALIESELAEIIYWTQSLGDLNGNGNPNDPEEWALLRRVLLIRPDLSPAGANVATFLQSNDVSVRVESGSLVANSLGDLTRRENRTFHSSTFPHAMNVGSLSPIPNTAATGFGTDVVMTKVVAFDVRVYDPLAPVMVGTNSALTPGDPGWSTTGTLQGRGAYVDLNYAGDRTISFYSGPPNTRSLLTAATWSNWPFVYEQDGVDQDGGGGIDQGTNGFNDIVDRYNNATLALAADGNDDNPLADDPGEYETQPPYPHAIVVNGVPEKMLGLRGVEVRIRIVEPDTRTVRQATVVSSFVPD